MSARKARLLSGLAAVVTLVALASVAHASSDYTCWPRWTLKRRDATGCNNVPFLSPANDSRVNLLLLLADSGQVTIAASTSDFWRRIGYDAVPFPLDALNERDETRPGNVPASDVAGETNGETLATLAAQIGEPIDESAPRPATSFALGEGNRCRSNTNDAARAFLAQVIRTPEVPDAERKELARSRLALLAGCTWDQAEADRIAPANVQSAAGREFASYLRAAIAFYSGRYDDARRGFDSLRDGRQAWIVETAQYMVGRTELNRAQQNAFDESGYPSSDRVDRPALEASDAAFAAYLHDHPNGLYAASAKGLLRRVYWFMDDRRRLAREYAWLLAHPETPLLNISRHALVREIDTKLLGPDAGDVDEPRLAAVMDLMAMRDAKPEMRARLEAQRPVFAEDARLYDYLSSAFRFYVEGDAAGTLKSLPGAAPDAPLDYLSFSQQTLRGFALEATGAWPAARTLWRTLLPLATRPLQRQQLELVLAMNCERSGRLADVFANDSPIQTLAIRKILLRQVAGPDLLRKQVSAGITASERDTALFTLLDKELSSGRYRAFAADLALLPKDVSAPASDPSEWPRTFSAASFAWRGGRTEAGYTCPSLREVAEMLRKNPKAPVGLNCLGEFILRTSLDELPLAQPSREDLGGGPSAFPAVRYSRLDGYMQVMADGKAGRDDRAYALYRAINCFARSGNNHCGSQDIAPSRRKQWFRTLKERYRDTLWAKELAVYW
jgi:hypothetical protein